MKIFRLLAASLLVAVCTGFSSCGDDELEREPVINFDPNGSDLEKKYSQYIDDYENMTCKRFEDKGDTIEFTPSIKYIRAMENMKRSELNLLDYLMENII